MPFAAICHLPRGGGANTASRGGTVMPRGARGAERGPCALSRRTACGASDAVGTERVPGAGGRGAAERAADPCVLIKRRATDLDRRATDLDRRVTESTRRRQRSLCKCAACHTSSGKCTSKQRRGSATHPSAWPQPGTPVAGPLGRCRGRCKTARLTSTQKPVRGRVCIAALFVIAKI